MPVISLSSSPDRSNGIYQEMLTRIRNGSVPHGLCFVCVSVFKAGTQGPKPLATTGLTPNWTRCPAFFGHKTPESKGDTGVAASCRVVNRLKTFLSFFIGVRTTFLLSPTLQTRDLRYRIVHVHRCIHTTHLTFQHFYLIKL